MSHLYVESKVQHKVSMKPRYTEQTCGWEGRVGREEKEFALAETNLSVGWINNKVALYSTGNYYYLWQTIVEKNMKKNDYNRVTAYGRD